MRIDAGVTSVTSLEKDRIAEEEDMSVEVHSSGGDIGAEIAGIDISKPLSASEIVAVEAAFVDRTVLVFRGQKLTDRQFADFSAQFGPLRVHIQKPFQHPDIPEIVYNRNVDADGKFDEVGASRGSPATLNTVGIRTPPTRSCPPSRPRFMRWKCHRPAAIPASPADTGPMRACRTGLRRGLRG